jgi:hypothetical protein
VSTMFRDIRLRRLARATSSGWPDLNRRPLDPQSSALTKLRHSPCAVLPGQSGEPRANSTASPRSAFLQPKTATQTRPMCTQYIRPPRPG